MLDYHILSETTNEEGETVRKILLVVAYRELVDRYVAACRDAGLSLVGIDLEAFALLRSLAAPREDEGPAPAALVAVAVGHDRSTFAVSDGRVCEFTRVLDWGGSTLSVAIARALDMTPSETDPIKHAISLEPGPAPEGVSEEVAAAARDAVKAQINNFARELVSSLQFYQNQPGSLGIGEIILTGGTAHLPGFAAELQRLIGVRVKLGDPLVRVKVGKRVQGARAARLARDRDRTGDRGLTMRAVNLLPRDDPNRRTKTNVPVVVGVAGAVLSTALIGMMFMSRERRRARPAAAARRAARGARRRAAPGAAELGPGRARGRAEGACDGDLGSDVAPGRLGSRAARGDARAPRGRVAASLAGSSPASPGRRRPAAGGHDGDADGLHAQGLHLFAGQRGPRAHSPDGRAGSLQRPARQSGLGLVGTQNIVSFTIVANIRPPLGAAS